MDSGHEPALVRPAYRPDVDGLRAIAVAAVILFHASVPGCGGGYVGVDVFFVISGYLITQLILVDRDGGLGVRLTRFYLRRARRILPALLTMLAVTAVAAVVILLPRELVHFGKYLAATPVLLANVAAWSQVDYFDTAWPVSPLLHTWSIAVEEQFYLAYPLALILCSRYWPRARLAALTVIAAGSLGLCIWAAGRHPVPNFYLPPSRAWELLLGALVAVAPLRMPRIRALAELLAAAALAVILASVVGYRATLAYPGLYTVPVCVATAALLVCERARPTLVQRLLALRPLAYVGLLSYSLYLWHMPVIALARYLLIEPPPARLVVAMLAAIVVLAASSYRLIEQPVRTRVRLASGRAFGWSVGLASAGIAAVGVGLWASGGFAARFSPAVRAYASGWDSVHRDARHCMTLSVADLDAGRLCQYGSAAADAPVVLVWGDSHAMALLPAYQRLAEVRGLRLYFGAHSSCRPLLGAWPVNPGDVAQRNCDEFNRAMSRAIGRMEPQLVILNAFWSIEEQRYAAPSSQRGRQLRPLAAALTATLDAIGSAGQAVCVVLDPPLLPYAAPYALAMAERRGLDHHWLEVSRSDALAQHAVAEAAIRRLAARDRLLIVDLKDELCRGDSCVVERGGRSLYMDEDHLSIEGALAVTGVLESCLADLPALAGDDGRDAAPRPAQSAAPAPIGRAPG